METLASGLSAPANAENTAQVETPEADAGGVAANGDGSAPSAPEAGTPAPKKDAVQERFDKLTREKYDNARLADQRGYELEQERSKRLQLEAEIEKLRKSETSQVAPDKFPTLEQFGYDEAKFYAAVSAYTQGMTESAKAAAREAAKAEIQAERDASRQEQAAMSWTAKEAEFIKLKPDYVDKVRRAPRDGGPVITKPMADLIMASEVGPQIAYYLGENVEKSVAISRLPPIEQAREVGRIEARLEAAKAPPKPAVSQAPPPVNKVDQDNAVVEKDPSTMSDTEFAKWRKRQIAARRG